MTLRFAFTIMTLAAATVAAPAAPAAQTAPASAVVVAEASSRLSSLGADELYRRGLALEATAHAAQAVPLYREASLRGHAAASQRLMELYADGAPGLVRDYRVAVFYKERALSQGASLDPAWRH